MRRKMLIFLLGVMLCVPVFQTCKSPNSPEPIKTSDVLEFMYERVLPIVFPGHSDPNGFTIFNDDGGGRNPHSWHKIAENKLMAEDELKYTGSQYMIWLSDPCVVPVQISIARKICVKIKGSSEWIELTRIKPNLFQDGEQAEFILDSKGIHAIF